MKSKKAKVLLVVGVLALAPFLPVAGAEAEAGAGADENGFTPEDRAWWAVQPVKVPSVPDAGEDWARNDIDRFIAGKLAAAGLDPAAEADRYELVRRACFDLHGMPPAPEQVDAFVSDARPDAWERLIDELLSSPRYGERWGQHWLDVVRWAESDGYRQDQFRPEAWMYRSYVIDSFNADKPYDQFVREQLAGDEIAPGDPAVTIGTAFLRHGIYEYNQRDARMHWELIVNEMTNVTGEAFLGLGVGCAQCHDHKFDPILQRDYYALQAFLATTCWPEGRPLATKEQIAAHQEKQRVWEEATREVQEEMDAMMQGDYDGKVRSVIGQFPEDIQQICAKPREERTAYEQQLVMLVERQIVEGTGKIEPEKSLKGKPEKWARYQELATQLATFEHLKPDPLPEAFISTDVGPEPAKTFLTKRSGKTEVQPAFLTLLGLPEPDIEPTQTSTGRRRALANWIASENNPLSTRVIVNRIWQHHFGRGIVPTPNDFGTLGEEPSHLEILDWLTTRFLEGGWQMKDMHRLIMTSAAYRQTARREPTSVEDRADPGNRLLWRFPPQRLAAEQVRDAMLAVSGELKHRESGASVDGETPYRSIYVKKIRNSPDGILNGFDAPMGFESAPTRPETTTPTQSLLLVNGDWVLSRAQAFAKRLLAGSPEVAGEAIARAYQIAYGRSASPEEIRMALEFVESQRGAIPVAPALADKYPGETGLRPIGQAFGKVAGVPLGTQALWLQPGSRFERLHLAEIALTGDEFTVEAVTSLDRIYADASVNTLVSRWKGSQQTPGWSFGVTSAQSRFQHQNFILQLVGDDFQGSSVYEVVVSDFRVPLQTPVYLAAAISATPSPEDETSGTATFYYKDLSDPKAELQSRVVKHAVVDKIDAPEMKLLLGGRDQKGHLWDGQLARLAISAGVLKPEQLLVGAKAGQTPRIVDWTFAGDDGERPAPGTEWVRQELEESNSGGIPQQDFGAMADFCHALFNSNEFLYLH